MKLYMYMMPVGMPFDEHGTLVDAQMTFTHKEFTHKLRDLAVVEFEPENLDVTRVISSKGLVDPLTHTKH